MSLSPTAIAPNRSFDVEQLSQIVSARHIPVVIVIAVVFVPWFDSLASLQTVTTRCHLRWTAVATPDALLPMTSDP
jgi:hypothetical protein